MPPQLPFDPSVEPQAASQKVSRHHSPLLASSQWFLVSPAGAQPHSCKFFNTLCWQLDSFLVNFLPTHLSLIYAFLAGRGEGITACHSWFTVLCLTSSNYQCSKFIFLACQSWFVVFNPPDCWSALIIQLNKYVEPINFNKIWSLQRIIPSMPVYSWVFSISSLRFFRIFLLFPF